MTLPSDTYYRVTWGLVANQAEKRSRRPLWARIRDTTGLGSTRASEVCQAMGFDPETGRKLPAPAPGEGDPTP